MATLVPNSADFHGKKEGNDTMIHPDSIPRLREGQTRIQEAVATLRKARMEGWKDTKEIETRLSEIAGQLRADTAEAIAEARRRATGVEVDWEVLEGMGGLNAWVLKEIVAGALEEMEEGESATEETWKTNIEVCVVYESVWEEIREELELDPGTLTAASVGENGGRRHHGGVQEAYGGNSKKRRDGEGRGEVGSLSRKPGALGRRRGPGG